MAINILGNGTDAKYSMIEFEGEAATGSFQAARPEQT